MNKIVKDILQLSIKDKNKAILIVSLSILILSGTIFYHVISSHKDLVENMVNLKKSSVEETFLNLEKNSYHNYKIRIKAFTILKKDLIDLFAQKDRVGLYEKIQPLYETLKTENPYFYVMHFHLPDGRTFLRMHKPDVYGDDLRGVRPIVDAVHQHHLQLSGFEVGRHGAFYRIVQPVFSDNNYIGCLEFGIRVHQLLQMAEADLGGQGAAYFLRDEWAKATKVEKHHKTMRPFGKFVLNTHDRDFFQSLPDTFNVTGHGTRMDRKSGNYMVYSWPLFKDYRGEAIGGVVVFQNISALVDHKNHDILSASVIIIFLTSLSLFTLVLCLNKLTKNLTDYHEKLKENETVLLNAQKMAHIGSWKYDLKQQILSWSDEVYRIFGLSPQGSDPSYEIFLNAIHPEDRQRVDEAYSDAVTNNAAYDVTHRIIRPDGEVRVVHQQSENIPDSSGKTNTSLGVIHDITDVKNVESSLRQSKEQWEKTFNSIQDIITVQDPEMNILKINQAGCDFLGISQQEASGRHCYELFRESDEPCPDCPLLVTKESFESYSKETIHEKLGRTFLVNASAVLNNDGGLEYIVRVAKDVTEKKKIENQLFHNEKLATIAGLAAGVAHEINTPLSVILQSQQVIEMRLDPDNPRSVQGAAECDIDLDKLKVFLEKSKIASMLKNSSRSAVNAGNIVTSLLEFSRPHQSSIREENVVNLLETTLNLARSDYSLKKRYDLRNVTLETAYDPKLTTISCVATEIEQVVLNLIKNAVHALADNRVENPEIKISTSLVNDMARIEVEDNGPGVDENIHRRIFDPFFTTKNVDEGTGLGLFVSRAIVVDKHKGNMWLDSESGKGARFVIELPLSIVGFRA